VFQCEGQICFAERIITEGVRNAIKCIARRKSTEHTKEFSNHLQLASSDAGAERSEVYAPWLGLFPQH